MEQLQAVNVISVIERALNCVDERLIDHGKRVAYKVFKILKYLTFDATQIREACIIALLHDIGAYKTENINRLLYFETEDVWEHSIYGYLFIKFFSPMGNMSPFLLLHHANCGDLERVHPYYHTLSQIIFITDRLDILAQSGIEDEKTIRTLLNQNRGVMFYPDIVDLVLENNVHIFDGQYNSDVEFNNMLYQHGWSEAEIEAYLKMIIFSIDFRSPQTVTHTIATTCISKTLSEVLPLKTDESHLLTMGAWLHDLGKSGIPIEILEYPGKINSTEMDIVRKHILLTDHILLGNVSDEIRLMALRHHEKLDGSGYPDGLRAPELSLPERVVAVADIFSALYSRRSYKKAFSKSKVISILRAMSLQGLLDGDVVDAAAKYYDAIIERISRASKPILDIYREMSVEYMELNAQVNNIGRTAERLSFSMKQNYSYKLAPISEW